MAARLAHDVTRCWGSNMMPRFPAFYQRNDGIANTKMAGKNTLFFTAFSNSSDILIGQFGLSILLSAQAVFGKRDIFKVFRPMILGFLSVYMIYFKSFW